MKTTTFFVAACSAALVACGDALGPEDTFDMVGTWEAKATPADSYDCHVEDLTLIITPPPADSVWLLPGLRFDRRPGSFAGTSSGGAAKCLNWQRNPLPPGVVWGRAWLNDASGAWELELSVYIEEEQFQLGLSTGIRNASHIEGVGTMGGGGGYYETCGWEGCGYDVTTFGVDVTLTRR